MSSVRVLATDLAFPEGPVAMPDGSVIVVEIRAQQLPALHRGTSGAARRCQSQSAALRTLSATASLGARCRLVGGTLSPACSCNSFAARPL